MTTTRETLAETLAAEHERALRDQFDRDGDRTPLVEVELHIGPEPAPAGAHLRARVIELLEALDAIAPVTISELVSDYTGLGRSDRLLAAELALRVAVRSDNARLYHQLVRLGREYSAPVGWQDRVWQRIAVEPRPSILRRLWRRLTGGRRW